MDAQMVPKSARMSAENAKVEVVIKIRTAVPTAAPESVTALVYEKISNLWSFKDSGKTNRVHGGALRMLRWYRDSAWNGKELPLALTESVTTMIAHVLQAMFVEIKYQGVPYDGKDVETTVKVEKNTWHSKKKQRGN